MNLGNESETIEFKKSTSELKEGVASIASILNKHGHGTLYFGVKNNGDVCGMQVADTTLREIGQAIDQSIEPRIHPEITKMDDGEGRDFIRINFEGNEPPYACKGAFRTRVSDSDVVMSAAEVRHMAADAEYKAWPWDERPSSRSIDDVDKKALSAYIERGKTCGRITFDYTDVPSTLARLGLVNDGKLTNAADMLFCTSKYPMLKMGVFANHDRVDILDIQQEHGTLFDLAKKAEFYILSNIRRKAEFDGSMERKEIPELPMGAVREAIINAFAHRSYRTDLAVQVEVFPDTVEIFSPGWFPEGHTPEAHLAGKDTSPLSPNKLIANTLFKSKDIESFATGLPRIQKLCNEEGIAFHYQKTPHGTKVVFERKDPFASLASTNSGNDVEFPTGTSRAEMRESSGKFGKVREKLGKELSAEELTVTEYAETNGSITSAKAMELTGFTDRGSQLLLKRLVEKGILNKVGAGRNTRYVLGDIVSGR